MLVSTTELHWHILLLCHQTLHPLLEDGCEGDEEPAPYKKVAFIGISNWALDPAKMNRGILVQRGVPDEQELEDSAKCVQLTITMLVFSYCSIDYII